MAHSILSINQSIGMTYLLKTILKREGIFISVSTIIEAITYLKKNRNVELLIVDVDFDNGEIWRFINFIKTSFLYNMPIIVLSSNSDAQFWREFDKSNADHAFIKPFDPNKLLKITKSLRKSSIM